jgi:hypothetical protein
MILETMPQKIKLDFDLRPSSEMALTSWIAGMVLRELISSWDVHCSFMAAKIIKSK